MSLNFAKRRVNSVLCEIFAQHHLLCEIVAQHPLVRIFQLLHPYTPQSQASEPLFVPSSCLRPEEDMLQLPRASRYHTRRAFATPVAPTQIPPRCPPTKKAKASEPGESSRAPRDSQSQPPSTRRPKPARPLRATPIAIKSISSLDFYQSMTTRGIPIADAFHIPYAPADPTAFRRWAPLSKWDMVRILSRGTSSQRTILRRELPPGMLLVDVVLRANLFPLQHRVQRQGPF
ncbi:hypothetical protein CK203_104912 [Vitis vinifera]|uniref:Uncharacterized protein n=1 Tax=Vitis vinifera TaxID=29760 RepID=A0A438BN38_VITVI|nr:hypothetical protein CK203_104912 [Vitis vinifera]